MRSIRTRTLLAVMAVAVAVVVPAGAAHAASIKAVCEFDGLTGPGLTPVQYLSNNGNFDFAGGANCAGELNNSPDVRTGLTLQANGTYSNIVCGTGTANGIANLLAGSSPLGSSAFGITFAAGQGVLSGTFTGDSSGPYAGTSGTTPGYVNISPGTANAAGAPPAGPCITQFQVHGAFLING